MNTKDETSDAASEQDNGQEEQTAGEENGETAEEAATEKWIQGFVLEEEIQELASSFSLSKLPTVTDWTDLAQGARGDAVVEAQEALIKLGFLEGAADGMFGPATAAAIQSFQQENGLIPTGTLDIIDWLYLKEQTGNKKELKVPYPPVFSVEDKFEEILEDVEDPALLEAFTDPIWNFDYDAYEGEGYITDKTILATYTDESRPVDTIAITVKPAVKIKRENTGMIKATPVIHIQSIGAYRPYVQALTLKAGNSVVKLTGPSLTGTLNGTQVEETADIPVSPEDLQNLQKSKDNSLEIRLNGNSRDYDLEETTDVQGLLDIIEKIG